MILQFSALRKLLALARTLCALSLLNAALPAKAADEPAPCPPVAQPPSAAQMEAVQRDARDHGFLWRISKGGRSSYLYGTLHVGKLAWTVPGPRVLEALMGSQALALELDLMDEKIVSQLTSTMAGGAAAPSASMPAAWQARVQRQMAAACLPAAALAAQHPVMQAITLTVLSARRDGLDPAYAQEFVLSGVAHAANKPVISLETPAQQMSALLPSDAKRARQMAEETLKQLEQGSARATLLRVAQVWERGDLDELAQYERWCDCIATEEDAAHLRQLNDERNSPLAERIDAIHSDGQTVFAAVGSLHMTGPKGLPRLLGQRGFTVERVKF
jgi:uncharacterized protein YbaP (TraB family)